MVPAAAAANRSIHSIRLLLSPVFGEVPAVCAVTAVFTGTAGFAGDAGFIEPVGAGEAGFPESVGVGFIPGVSAIFSQTAVYFTFPATVSATEGAHPLNV